MAKKNNTLKVVALALLAYVVLKPKAAYTSTGGTKPPKTDNTATTAQTSSNYNKSY